MKKQTPWYVAPYALLVIGIIIAGYVVWRMITHEHSGRLTNTNAAVSTCGNGICENVSCLSTNCPKPETAENCPQDCGGTDGITGSNDLGPMNVNQLNVNVSVDTTELRYTMTAQTAEQSALCPTADMNLTVIEALAVAQRTGLTQGIKEVSASLYHYDTPLDQCVWDFRSSLTATGGTSIMVIDSTQEIFNRTTWGT